MKYWIDLVKDHNIALTFRMKYGYGVGELAKFFFTVPKDAAKKPSYFYYQICRKDVSVWTDSHYEPFLPFSVDPHFPVISDQRLRLETSAWRVLGYQGQPVTEDKLEHQRDKISKGTLVVRDREHPFTEDLIVDAAG